MLYGGFLKFSSWSFFFTDPRHSVRVHKFFGAIGPFFPTPDIKFQWISPVKQKMKKSVALWVTNTHKTILIEEENNNIHNRV